MTSQPRKQTIAINIMLNVSRSKGNQAMKFGQLLQYCMTKKSRQKFKCLENKKRFSDEIKSIFQHFSLKQQKNKKISLEGESPTIIFPITHYVLTSR